MMISRPSWGSQLRMAGYSTGAFALTVAWAFDIGGAAATPAWLILIVAFSAWFVLPRLETRGVKRVDLSDAVKDEARRPFPSFPVWFLQNVPFVGMLASGLLFALSSGVMTHDPFSLNLGVRLAAVLFAFSVACMSFDSVLEAWIRRRRSRTATLQPPRRRRRWDGSRRP